MYTYGDVDYIVAESPEEAQKILESHTGFPVDIDEEAFLTMEEVNPENTFNFSKDPYDPAEPFITKTVAEWIEWNGKGYFASTEY